ncbi:hypothetical protein [Lonsdalea quercina]|uniref:hypothetical protein n=1 Tax=Lonsdalea quercina TaxID=71657 RepID=UPI0039760D96
MSFYVGTGYFPAYINSEKINNILESETPPEMSLWEKIKDFFCSKPNTADNAANNGNKKARQKPRLT